MYYRFTIGDFSLPNTPIARQNKIRRNAWLSDHTTSPRSSLLVLGTPPTNERPVSYVNNKNTNDFNSSKLQIEKFDKVPKTESSEQSSKYNISVNDKDLKNEANEKNSGGRHYNVSIKIHRNELDQSQPASKILNGVQEKGDSINIKLFTPEIDLVNATGPVIKINNNFIDLDQTPHSKIDMSRSEIEDINKKYYPQMPELLSEVLQKSRDRSFILKTNEPSKRASVKDVVKFIESTYKDVGLSYNSVKPKRATDHMNDDEIVDGNLFTTQPMNEITPRPVKPIFDSYLKPKSPKIQINQIYVEPAANESLKCLQEASDSISRLSELLDSPRVQTIDERDDKPSDKDQEIISEMNPSIILNKKFIASSAPAMPKKKITTKVTVNFKKITRRSSDVGQVQQFCKMDENGRHAICSNSELVKRFSHQLKMCADANKTTSNQDLVPRMDISANCKKPKYFCKNCGFSMLPTEMLQGC